jgi:hypothetical protein
VAVILTEGGMGKVLRDPFTLVVGAKWSYSENQKSPLKTEDIQAVILVLNSSICIYLCGKSDSGIGNINN